MRKKFRREPAENDIKWGLLNKELIDHSKDGAWGRYRNTRLSMAQILEKEQRHLDAMDTYLEVCYLDLSNPDPMDEFQDDPEFMKLMLDDFGPVNIDADDLATGVTYPLGELVRNSGLSRDAIESRFIANCGKIQLPLKRRISPEEAWPIIADSVFEEASE